MKIACLSGKGGAGKTLVAVNLAVTAGTATYIDCDVVSFPNLVKRYRDGRVMLDRSSRQEMWEVSISAGLMSTQESFLK